jgi:hypothetical protein
MSAVPSISPSAKVLPLQVLVKGKVEASRRFDGKRYTRIITPAADAYSRPQVVEVRSVSKLGDLGDETEITCRLGGYTRKPYRTTDKETGETSMVTPVDLTLDAVE